MRTPCLLRTELCHAYVVFITHGALPCVRRVYYARSSAMRTPCLLRTELCHAYAVFITHRALPCVRLVYYAPSSAMRTPCLLRTELCHAYAVFITHDPTLSRTGDLDDLARLDYCRLMKKICSLNLTLSDFEINVIHSQAEKSGRKKSRHPLGQLAVTHSQCQELIDGVYAPRPCVYVYCVCTLCFISLQ